MTVYHLPEDFYFGGATAAYQVEGATKEDGKGEVIWDKYLHEQGTINPDPAADFYHRYPTDLDLCKKFHINAIRVSIDWARIFPEGTGKLEPRGVAYYHKLFKKVPRRRRRAVCDPAPFWYAASLARQGWLAVRGNAGCLCRLC